jgi:hypothetical protein
MNVLRRWCPLLLPLLIVSCGKSLPPIDSCEPGAGMTPDCRFRNPEDLVSVPGGGRLIVSQMGKMDGSEAGNLALYVPNGEIRVLVPGAAVVDDRRWGAADCSPPDMTRFSPHGLDLLERADGRWMLLAVNHGGRESVEFFEVMNPDGNMSLEWRGCAAGPQQAAFNDVAGRRDGGFYVTHMYPHGGQTLALLKATLLGSDTGFVYAWSQPDGWSVVPGSRGPLPNGIALGADEDTLYVNMYLAGQVRKLDLASGEVTAVYEGGNPDNSTWGSDGRLLVATHTAGFSDLAACMRLTAGSCGFAFRVVSLDPETLAPMTLVEHAGAPTGGVTVALDMEGRLYLGTFAGDRITSMPIAVDK